MLRLFAPGARDAPKGKRVGITLEWVDEDDPLYQDRISDRQQRVAGKIAGFLMRNTEPAEPSHAPDAVVIESQGIERPPKMARSVSEPMQSSAESTGAVAGDRAGSTDAPAVAKEALAQAVMAQSEADRGLAEPREAPGEVNVATPEVTKVSAANFASGDAGPLHKVGHKHAAFLFAALPLSTQVACLIDSIAGCFWLHVLMYNATSRIPFQCQ